MSRRHHKRPDFTGNVSEALPDLEPAIASPLSEVITLEVSPVVSPEPLAEVIAPPEPPVIEAAPIVPLLHEASGRTCNLGNHYDGQGACIVCRHCNIKIRPQFMTEVCPAR